MGKFGTVRCIVNIEQPQKRLVLFAISLNIIKTSHRENFFSLSISKLNATLTQNVFSFSLSFSKTGLRLCRINLGRNQITLFLQILFHFLRNFLISNQLINLRHSFRIKTMLNLNISLIVSALELFINFINGKLDLLTLFLDKIPIEFKALRIFGNIRVFRIATKFLGFGVQLINSSISNCLFILHALTFGDSSNKIKITRTHRSTRIWR